MKMEAAIKSFNGRGDKICSKVTHSFTQIPLPAFSLLEDNEKPS